MEYSNEDLRKSILEGFKITFDKIANLKRECAKASELNKLREDIGKLSDDLKNISLEIEKLKNH